MDNHAVETTLYSLGTAPPKQPRTRAQRHLTLYRVGVLTVGDHRELCLIKNVSAGGMLIRAYSDVAVGTRLSVELKHGEALAGAAKWIEQDSVGIAFDAPIDVFSLISLPAEGPQPRMPRIEVDCTATVRDGSTVARTKAINISQGGLSVESRTELAVGTAVVVSLNGLAPEPAVVKWRDSDCYGIAFNRTLSVSQLVEWLQARHSRQAALTES